MAEKKQNRLVRKAIAWALEHAREFDNGMFDEVTEEAIEEAYDFFMDEFDEQILEMTESAGDLAKRDTCGNCGALDWSAPVTYISPSYGPASTRYCNHCNESIVLPLCKETQP